jgi:eukaryotic-like serine/threonine-protein kinase
MPMPVRLVCAYCLDSVESSLEGETLASATCPSCGSPIDCSGPPTRVDATAEHYPSGDSLDSVDLQTVAQADARRKGRIGRFLIRDRIGGGGYGDVFNAFDPRLEREVALKILKTGKLDAKATERFLREARAAAKLNHKNIVALYDAGQDDGRLWIAYRLIEGLPLSQLRDARTLELRSAVAIVRDLSDALRHAHARGICHRDIKPANVIVDEDGVPYLTDFGLARRVDVESELTGEGTVLGTPAYMSPEQAAGRANAADGRSDIYSLGVILYELICGRRPSNFPSNTPYWKIERKTPPPTPQSLVRNIPHSLDRICMKALALNPDDRYQDAAALTHALNIWLDRQPTPRTSKGVSAGTLGALMAVAAVAMVVLGVSAKGLNKGEAAPKRVVVATVPPKKALVTIIPPVLVTLVTPKTVAPTTSPALEPVVTPGSEEKVDWVFIASKKSKTKTLHWDRDCPRVRDIEPKNRITFSSLEEAERHEFRSPCTVCHGRPPGAKKEP